MTDAQANEPKTVALDAEHTVGAASARRLEALKPHRWKPGQSGNPRGAIASFAYRVRRETRRGRDVLEFLLRVMRGEEPRTEMKHRLAAAGMLLDRGYGRAPVAVTIGDQRPAGDATAAIAAAIRTLPQDVQVQLALALTQQPAELIDVTPDDGPI